MIRDDSVAVPSDDTVMENTADAVVVVRPFMLFITLVASSTDVNATSDVSVVLEPPVEVLSTTESKLTPAYVATFCW